jgi:hypothetical protein
MLHRNHQKRCSSLHLCAYNNFQIHDFSIVVFFLPPKQLVQNEKQKNKIWCVAIMNYCLLAFSKLCYKVLSLEIIEFDPPTGKQLLFLGKQGLK